MDEILTNDGLALAITEYTGDIVAGEGLEFDQNVLNVVGKMDSDFIRFVETEEEAIAGETGKIYIVTGANA